MLSWLPFVCPKVEFSLLQFWFYRCIIEKRGKTATIFLLFSAPCSAASHPVFHLQQSFPFGFPVSQTPAALMEELEALLQWKTV